MATGLNGTYILRASQVFFDGVSTETLAQPQVGQIFSWKGDPVRLDGPQSLLSLDALVDQDDVRTRAARIARRRFDLTIAPHSKVAPEGLLDAADPTEDGSFVISDGQGQFMLRPMRSQEGREMLYVCAAGLPMPDTMHRVIAVPEAPNAVARRVTDFGGDVICFTTGTRIETDCGSELVENLSVGDKVQTKDDGAQEILWIGHRRMSGARLHAMPELRPIRLRRDALGGDIPDGDLLVSPQHRVLISGARAQALFNQPEVLVTARDLINDTSVFVDHAVREVTYVHLLFANHQILWANGVPSESYHPAHTTLDTVDVSQRGSLLDVFPQIKDDPHAYGPFARRNLDRSEAAIYMAEL